MHLKRFWEKMLQFTKPSKTEKEESVQKVCNIERLKNRGNYDMQRLFIPTPSFRFDMGPIETFRVFFRNATPPFSHQKLAFIPHITMDMSRITLKECKHILKYLHGEWVPNKGRVRDNWTEQKGASWSTRVEFLEESMKQWIEDREKDYLKAWMSGTKVSGMHFGHMLSNLSK